MFQVEECFSEDPYLSGEMAYSVVTGLQSLNVSATVKHFLGYAAPEQGLNTGPVHGGERELRTTYVIGAVRFNATINARNSWMPAFKRAIVDASAWGIMGAYHS
jgi:beta-glucosidase